MKITLCGSIAFYDEMQAAQKLLEALGHEVKLPPSEIIGEQGAVMTVKQYYDLRKASTGADSWIWERKAEAMRNHFNKVIWSDAILVLNHQKNGIEGYIGANTLLEMGLAFHHDKNIYLLNKIPEISYKEEILGMRPDVIQGDFSLVK